MARRIGYEVSVVLVQLPGLPWAVIAWYYYEFNLALLLLTILRCVWMGAQFYVDVFSVTYRKVKQRGKEKIQMQSVEGGEGSQDDFDCSEQDELYAVEFTGLVHLPTGPLQVVSARNNIITYKIAVEDERPWTKSVGVVDLPFELVKKVAMQDAPMALFAKHLQVAL
jgi:hypothetical protein